MVEREICSLTVKDYKWSEKNVHSGGKEKPLNAYVIKVGFRNTSDDGVGDAWQQRGGNREARWDTETFACLKGFSSDLRQQL